MNNYQKTEKKLNEFIEKEPNTCVDTFVHKEVSPGNFKHTAFVSLGIMCVGVAISASIGMLHTSIPEAPSMILDPLVRITSTLGLFLTGIQTIIAITDTDIREQKRRNDIYDKLNAKKVHTNMALKDLTSEQKQILVEMISEHKDKKLKHIISDMAHTGKIENILETISGIRLKANVVNKESISKKM